MPWGAEASTIVTNTAAVVEEEAAEVEEDSAAADLEDGEEEEEEVGGEVVGEGGVNTITRTVMDTAAAAATGRQRTRRSLHSM